MSTIEPWADDTEYSDARSNKMTMPHVTGDTLAGLDKSRFGLVKCVADQTGGGYLMDHLYLAPTDPDDPWIDVTKLQDHFHTDANDGGYITGIFINNPTWFMLQYTTKSELLKANWEQQTGSGGSIEDYDTGIENAIRLHTNSTNGGSAQVFQRHIQMNWGLAKMFQVKVIVQDLTNIALHAGVNVDDITVADTNTRKIGFEICTTLSPPADQNWNVRSADGSNKSVSDTGIAFTADRTGLRLEHYPNASPPRIDAYLAINTTTPGDVFEKTSFIPGDENSTTDNNLLRFGFKNSTNSDRHFAMLGCRLIAKIRDEWA